MVIISYGYMKTVRRDIKTAELKKSTLEEYLNRLVCVHGKHPSWKSAGLRTLNRIWNRDLLLYACQNCDYNLHVELCHITDISSWPKSATLGEINSPTNILVLCRNCHWEFDQELLDISAIKPRDTMTHSRAAMIKKRPSEIDSCPNCDGQKSIGAKVCLNCYKPKQVINWPSMARLTELVNSHSMSHVSRLLGVSTTAIRSHIKYRLASLAGIEPA